MSRAIKQSEVKPYSVKTVLVYRKSDIVYQIPFAASWGCGSSKDRIYSCYIETKCRANEPECYVLYHAEKHRKFGVCAKNPLSRKAQQPHWIVTIYTFEASKVSFAKQFDRHFRVILK